MWSSAVLAYSWLTVSAADTTISVTVNRDYCSNIPGAQSNVPAGMVVGPGDVCYTPPPPPVDMCANLSGNQSTVPSGYFRDANGNCFLQPSPPTPTNPTVDVCPNIDGIQEIVPAEYIQDGTGNCVLPPVDMCANIDGIQLIVPEGMTKSDDNVCETPAPEPTPTDPDGVDSPAIPPVAGGPTTPPSGPRQPSGNSPANVPTFLAPIVMPLVELVPQQVRETLRSVPPVVAQSFPYYIFIILAMGAVALWAQAIREATTANYLLGLLKREQSIAEQKDNFMALASHYMRTPLTVMVNGLDTMIALKEVPQETATQLRIPLANLGKDIEDILSSVENNTALGDIQKPVLDIEEKSFLRSSFFWTPVLASMGITLLANFLLGIVGEVEIGTLNLIVQMVFFVMVIFFFYTALRNHYIRKQTRAQQQKLVDHERAIDQARNTFLDAATSTLQGGVNTVASLRPSLENAQSVRFFDDGYNRFVAILSKFNLLSQIRAGATLTMQQFELHELVDEILMRQQKQALDKNITILNASAQTNVSQQRDLLVYVLDSLVDNAIKFTAEGGTIRIDSQPNNHKLSISITDTGAGIDEDKQLQLFKPFSRTESAVEFNYEGLGFSLFLDKIIMEYLEGDIAVASEPQKGSTFTITAANNYEVEHAHQGFPATPATPTQHITASA